MIGNFIKTLRKKCFFIDVFLRIFILSDFKKKYVGINS